MNSISKLLQRQLQLLGYSAIDPNRFLLAVNGYRGGLMEEDLIRYGLLKPNEPAADMKLISLPVERQWAALLNAEEKLIIDGHLIVGLEKMIDSILCEDQSKRRLQLNVELSGKCNLRCHYCSLDQTLENRGNNTYMTLKTLNDVFDLILNSTNYKIDGAVCLWNGGEPLLHPQFDQVIGLIAERRNPGQQFSLITNGTPLVEKKTRLIVDSGVINEIVFSLDGGTPALFEELRAPARWLDVSRKIHSFMDYNDANHNPIKTTVNMVLDPRLDDYKIAPEFQEILDRVDRFDCNYPQSEAGEKPVNYIDRYEVSSGICALVKFRQYVVLWNGDVTMCCSDLNGKLAFGDVQSFDEIYAGRTRRHYIRKMLLNDRASLEGCANCNQPEVLPTSDGSGFWDTNHIEPLYAGTKYT